jgi:Ca-activated chloride channel family protein
MTLRAATFVVAVALAAAPAAPSGDQQRPTFRAGVRTVPVYATVSDETGSLVLDLTREDFEVKDNGRVQEITQFTTTLQPLTAMVMIDGSGSMLPAFSAVLDGASAFVIRMLPEDKVRIGSFADLIRMGPEFTSNRDALLEYLRNEFNIRMANETRLWDGLREAVLTLGDAEGRRAVVVFTDGYDTSSVAGSGRVLFDARRHDVLIYAVNMWTGRGTKLQRPGRDLELLAAETGGGYYELMENDEMNSTFTRIATELHHQYVLGFTPRAFDGTVHELSVKVKRPRMKVKARKSYIADPEGR